jgi:hypothetical protein
LINVIGFNTDKCRRQKYIVGCIPNYNINYKGKDIINPVANWDTIPIIRDMAEYITNNVTGTPINTVTIHFYPTGNVGIKPHRDK